MAHVFFQVLFALGFALLAFSSARAAGTVSSCTEDELRAAVAGGGLVTFSSNCSITITQPIPIAFVDTTIDAGSNTVTISGGGSVSLFSVTNNLRLVGLTLANGKSTNGIGGALFINAGATVIATNCTFTGNSAVGPNGTAGAKGADNSSGRGHDGGDGTGGAVGYGGVAYNLGRLTLINCKLLTNSATGGVGGAGGGGGNGDTTLSQGGNGGKGGDGAIGYGGAIFNLSNLTLINCTFSGNSATGGNGGAGGTNGAGRFLSLAGSGGAGAAGAGGAVYNAKNLSLWGCTFSGNTVTGGTSAAGGNKENGIGSTGERGGDAVGAGLATTWWAVLTNSTFFANKATGGNGGNGGGGSGSLPQAGNGGDGGNGVGGGLFDSGTLTVVNCTFSSNGASGGTNGVAGSGTFAGSDGHVGQSQGGNIAAPGGPMSLRSSILTAPTSGGNAYGTFTDDGLNLSSTSVSSFGGSSFQNSNPKLGALASNGGPTMTMALLAGSPAIDKVPVGLSPTVDQREVPRPQGAKSDIGAFEYSVSNLPVITSQPADLSVPQGSSAVFSAAATGLNPIHYQWRFNGTNISGATLTNLTIANVQSTNAGGYDVIVSNVLGSVTSRRATLAVLFNLGGSVREGTNGLSGVTVTVGNKSLLTDSSGNYKTNLPAGTYTVTPSLTNFGFQPASLAITLPPSTNSVNFSALPLVTIGRAQTGQIELSGVGTAGQTYQVEVSTNLVNWQSISTNVAPVQFMDSLTNLPSRFYRLKR
jgi:hypothetical protein